MSHFSRTRSALARTVAVGALSLVAGGLLVACGDDDSSATGSPTTTSAASPTTNTKPTVKSGTPQASEAPATPDQGSDAEAEQPQAVPSGFPGPLRSPSRRAPRPTWTG